MDISQKILSDITVFLKYAKYTPSLNRREIWTELVDRNKAMHLKKYPQLADEIENTYKFVYDKKILPSMRSMQFAGKPIEISPNRIYNCAYAPVDDWRTFGEIIFLLLGGTGIGFSVQKHHVEKLPEIRRPNPAKFRRYLISDSIEGWADAVKALVKSHFQGGSTLRFDYSDIRPKGAALITSGGKAPGPQPLKECLVKMQGILDRKEDGDKLEPIEVHDIVCHIADAVLAGGIRRAALISLFSADDEEMISCKSGNWWELNPQRGRANNSAALLRRKVTKEYFLDLWNRVKASGAGEPGIYFTNDKDWGTNPCCFVADTQIEVENGKKSILEIVEGLGKGEIYRAQTYNEETKQIELQTVKAGILSRKDSTVVELEVEEDGITYRVVCTPDHRFYTANRGWVECINLTHEDDLIIFNKQK